MDNNLVVIEVKPINAQVSGIEKDIKVLYSFITNASYYKAIYLVYGEEHEDEFQKFDSSVEGLMGLVPEDSFHLIWHKEPNTACGVMKVV
jgi:hypothetical protein